MQPDLRVEMLPTAALAPYAANARQHPEAQVQQLAASIREFGFNVPVLVDDAGVLIAGHGRVLAAKAIGLASIPTIRLGHLTEAQAKAYRLADNQLALNSTWDDGLLATELRGLLDAEFDLGLIGFDAMTLDRLLTGPDDDEQDGADPDAPAPAPPADPVSRPGDLWILGRHRLLCGDATNPQDVARLLDGVKPHLLGDVAYVWHAGVHARTVIDSLEAAGFMIRSQIIWAKPRFVLGRGDYHWQHEPCLYAVRKGATGHWQGARDQATLWSIGFGGDEDAETIHGTQKPVECMRRPIVNNSAVGDAVYEPFSGSGTTIIAAETTGRACCAMELDPRYVDVAVLRWQALTGKTATLEADGRPFAEVAAAREGRAAA